MILPGMGVVSELVTCFARKQIFGYKFICFSSLGIAVIGFMVWGHHLFVSGHRSTPESCSRFCPTLVAIPRDQGLQLGRRRCTRAESPT